MPPTQCTEGHVYDVNAKWIEILEEQLTQTGANIVHEGVRNTSLS